MKTNLTNNSYYNHTVKRAIVVYLTVINQDANTDTLLNAFIKNDFEQEYSIGNYAVDKGSKYRIINFVVPAGYKFKVSWDTTQGNLSITKARFIEL